MPEEPLSASINRELISTIVAAYVRHNQIGADQVATLISTVHQALSGLGKPVAELDRERTPVVPIRRSVHRDYVVCLECGCRGQMLRRHVLTGHGLTVEQYRTRWNLPREHALIAPAYSKRRSGLAKQLGLGRGGRTFDSDTPALEPAVAAKPSSRRRGTAPMSVVNISPLLDFPLCRCSQRVLVWPLVSRLWLTQILTRPKRASQKIGKSFSKCEPPSDNMRTCELEIGEKKTILLMAEDNVKSKTTLLGCCYFYAK